MGACASRGGSTARMVKVEKQVAELATNKQEVWGTPLCRCAFNSRLAYSFPVQLRLYRRIHSPHLHSC